MKRVIAQFLVTITPGPDGVTTQSRLDDIEEAIGPQDLQVAARTAASIREMLDSRVACNGLRVEVKPV